MKRLNLNNGISQDGHFLELFFRNLLMGENNELKNRYLLVNPPEEWKRPASAGQVQDKYRTSTHTSTRTSILVNTINTISKLFTNNENIIQLVRVIGYEEMSIKQMMEVKGLKHRQTFIEYHLNPAMKERFVRMKYPDRPHHPRQRYLLTVKGQMLYQELTKE